MFRVSSLGFRISSRPQLPLLLSLVLPLCLVSARAQVTNLLTNGTFESGTLAGWTANGASASTNAAHSGSWSARCTTQSMRATVSTVSGNTYKLTGWVLIASETGATNGWGGARIEAYDTSHGSWQTLAHSGWLLTRNRGTNWFKVALTFTATGSSTPIDVGYFGDSGRLMTVHFDDLMLFNKPATNTPPQLTVTLSPTNFTSLPQSQTFALLADDPDGTVQLVNWDFGDGTAAQVASGSRTVAASGQFIAIARVVDDEGAVVSRQVAWSAASADYPLLTVTTPAPDIVVNSASLNLAGTAAGTGLTVAATSDRGETASLTGTSNWAGTITLKPGWNLLLLQAKASSNQLSTVERRVRFEPSGALAVSGLAPVTSQVQRWDLFEATFNLDNSAATHPHFPYETNPPPGLDWLDGVSADGLFTPDNWRTVYRRPAFLRQPYQRQLKHSEEWLYPGTNQPVWTVRFAPPLPGTWRYRIEVAEARGRAQSAEESFSVLTPTNSLNHGPVRIARLDSRYFEHEDGSWFAGAGHGIGASAEAYSYDMESQFAAQGDANQHFFRLWIAGHLWGSAWQPWASATLGYNGTVPNTGLSYDSAYGDGLAAWKLDNINPMMWQGWNSGHPAVISGRQYRLRVRWRTDGVAGPAAAGQPYGICLRWTAWPDLSQTPTYPLVLSHVSGNTPWHVAETVITAAGTALQNSDFIANPLLVFENCTGGRAFVDEVSLREVLGTDALGGELLRAPRANSHLAFDQRRGAGLDAILSAAANHGKYFKLVISEKQEQLLNALGPGGLTDLNGGHFFDRAGSVSHRLHEYYWRHLIARLGAFRSVHSWETVNEEDPNSISQFQLTADLATTAHTDGNPKLASTSSWASLATNTWLQPSLTAIDYADFHCYVRGTGWLEPKDALANNSAAFFNAYDLAALAGRFGKPVVWGEQGIDGTSGTDGEDPLIASDTNGIWLHKLVWARTGPGGVVPLYWYIDNIQNKALHWRYGNWLRFMNPLPLNNGRYTNADAVASVSSLRVLGQRDLAAGRAHLWLDNTNHTWRTVVAGTPPSPITATVQVAMGTPNASCQVTWFNTTNGLSEYTQTLTADGLGLLVLNVTNLATDTAVQIARASTAPTAPQITSLAPLNAGWLLRWNSEPGLSYQVQQKADLNSDDWQDLGQPTATPGLTGDLYDPSANSHRFYRLKLTP